MTDAAGFALHDAGVRNPNGDCTGTGGCRAGDHCVFDYGYAYGSCCEHTCTTPGCVRRACRAPSRSALAPAAVTLPPMSASKITCSHAAGCAHGFGWQHAFHWMGIGCPSWFSLRRSGSFRLVLRRAVHRHGHLLRHEKRVRRLLGRRDLHLRLRGLRDPRMLCELGSPASRPCVNSCSAYMVSANAVTATTTGSTVAQCTACNW